MEKSVNKGNDLVNEMKTYLVGFIMLLFSCTQVVVSENTINSITVDSPESPKCVNLIKNAGFEFPLGEKGVPIYWYETYSGTGKAVDLEQAHTGKYSWRFKNDGSGFQGACSAPITVEFGNFYQLSAWVKSKIGQELVYLGWEEFDETDKSLKKSDFVLGREIIPRTWTHFSGNYLLEDRRTKYVKIRFFGPYKSKGEVWWDDFCLTNIGTEFLPEYKRKIGTKIKCLDFGSLVEDVSRIKYSRSAMTEKYDVRSFTYRKIKPKQMLDIEIPAFNVDKDGLPLTPMLLQIRFKDTLDDRIAADSRHRTRHRAFVHSRIDYIGQETGSTGYSSKKRFHKISHLGGFGDGQWRYMQYGFAKTPFQLLRAINGKFTIRISMPTNSPHDIEASLPIDYVLLRVISESDYTALSNKQRQLKGFYPAQLSRDKPSTQVNYSDPNLVVFIRDIMHPIYKHTKPGANEISKIINIFSAPGETEPIALGIYSKNGINNLTFTVSDFFNQTTNDIIPKKNISIARVIYGEKRLVPYGIPKKSKSYGLVPDYLKEVSSLSIGPDSCETLWLKMKIPVHISGGLYKGQIHINAADRITENIQVQVRVLPIPLALPEHINPVYRDPYNDFFDGCRDEVFKIYKEVGFDPFIDHTLHLTPVKNRGKIIDFKTTQFEVNLDAMIKEGFAKGKAFVRLSDWWYRVYYTVFGHSVDCKDEIFLYDKLSNQMFVDAFGLAIRKLNRIGDERGVSFIFSVVDEPNKDLFKRLIADRLHTIIKKNGGKTTVTYTPDCEQRVSSGKYITQDGMIPPLTNLIDYKVWTLPKQGLGYAKKYSNHGYYTTAMSYLRNPIYNRFTHGLFAFRTDAKVVSAYAMSDVVNDPFNDFDSEPYSRHPFSHPDFVFAYPTWQGKLLPTMALEGIREGIKDAKYIATLNKLIRKNQGKAIALEAQKYLTRLKGRIHSDYWISYALKTTSEGYYQAILRDISENNLPNDFDAFTGIRRKIFHFITELMQEPN